MNATARKTCEFCNVRPVPSKKVRQDAGMSADMYACEPCFEQASWENTHSDEGHENFEGLTVKTSTFRTKAALEAWKMEMRETTKACWICHPELDESKTAYVRREGTSRAGMVINVPIRAAGVEKANVTIAKLAEKSDRFDAKITTNKKTGTVCLTAKSAQESFILFWDITGRFTAGSVQENGKSRKVRNVAEVLRLAS